MLSDFYAHFNKSNIFVSSLVLIVALLPLSIMIGSLIINLSVIFICIFFLIIIFKYKEFHIFKDKFFILFLFFWLSLVLNLFFSTNFENSLTRTLGFFRFILLVYAIKYCLNFNNEQYSKFIYKIWLIIFLIVTFDLIFEYFIGFNVLGFKSYMPGRLSGFLNQELKIGHFYSAFFLICSVFILMRYKNKKIYYFSLIIFLIVSLMIGERSNFLRVFSIVVMFLIITENINVFKKFLILILSIISISGIVMSNDNLKIRFYEQFLKPAVFEFDINYLINSNMYFANYDRAYKIFKKNKYFGVGLKNFRIESQKEIYKNENLKFNHQAHTTHPHQVHLEFLSETGIFGYSCFIIFIIMSLWYSIKSYFVNKNFYLMASSLFLILSIAPILPSGSFFTTYGATLFWINFGIMVSNQKTK